MENLISTLQLRAGRAVLGIGVREIGSYVGVSGAAISLWENNKGHNNLKITPERNLSLIHFFQNRGVFFPDKKSISLIIYLSIYFRHLFQILSRRSSSGSSNNVFSLRSIFIYYLSLQNYNNKTQL